MRRKKKEKTSTAGRRPAFFPDFLFQDDLCGRHATVPITAVPIGGIRPRFPRSANRTARIIVEDAARRPTAVEPTLRFGDGDAARKGHTHAHRLGAYAVRAADHTHTHTPRRSYTVVFFFHLFHSVPSPQARARTVSHPITLSRSPTYHTAHAPRSSHFLRIPCDASSRVVPRPRRLAS